MSESFNIKGRVTIVKDQQTFASGFTKQAFVINDMAEKYSQDIEIEGLKDKCELVAALNVGDVVNVTFNISGREYNGSHYVNLQAWKIEVTAPAQAAPASQPLAFDPEEPLDEEPPF